MEGDKILIVEDSALLQRMYLLLLRRYREKGADIISVTNGKDALDKLRSIGGIKLVILDLNLPEMSGMEFLEYCKGKRLLAEIPVIVICTVRPGDDLSRVLAAGAVAYLEKPFKGEEFHELVSRFIKTG
jgi:CheY-like chemotaxis protein